MSTPKYVIIIFFLLLALAGTVFLTLRVTVFGNKAAGTGSTATVALENSYLFASPLQAKADNQEMVQITVFLLDSRGLGLANQLVSLDVPSTITVSSIQATTDDTGKALFNLKSAIPTVISVAAHVNSQTLPQKVKVTFY